MSDRQITKVKRSDATITVHHQTANANGDMDNGHMHSHDPASPALHEAFNALNKELGRILSLTEKQTNDVKVTGVTFTHKDGIMGAVIIAQKEVPTSSSVWNITTPHIPSKPYGEASAKNTPVLHADTIAALETLTEQAELFLRGERAQLNLDFASQKADREALIEKAVLHILETQRASSANIGKGVKLKGEALVRFVDELEESGIIGPVNGDKSREILVDSIEEAREKLGFKAA